MTTQIKTVLPSISIFRKRKKQPTDCELYQSPSDIGVNSSSPENNQLPFPPEIALHSTSADGQSGRPGGAAVYQASFLPDAELHAVPVERPTHCGTARADLSLPDNTLTGADRHRLPDTSATPPLEYPTLGAAALEFTGNPQTESPVVPAYKTSQEFDLATTAGAFLAASEEQPFWGTKSKDDPCECPSEYNFQIISQNVYASSQLPPQYFQFPEKSPKVVLWHESHVVTPAVSQPSPALPLQSGVAETHFDNSIAGALNSQDCRITAYQPLELEGSLPPCPAGHALDANVSYGYDTRCASDKLVSQPQCAAITAATQQRPDAGPVYNSLGPVLAGQSFQGEENYSDSYGLGYCQNENCFPGCSQLNKDSFIHTGEQLHTYCPDTQPAHALNSVPISTATDLPCTTHLTAYTGCGDTNGNDVSSVCEKEGDENEDEEDDCDDDNNGGSASDDGLKEKGKQGKNKVQSYIALISKAILNSPEKRLLISDIYTHIRKHNAGISTSQKSWQNSVRHNLSLNECFIKQVRHGKGRGHYWMIHPACVQEFLKGNFRRRQARRRAKKCPLTTKETNFTGAKVDDGISAPSLPLETAPSSLPLKMNARLWDAGSAHSPGATGGICSGVGPVGVEGAGNLAEHGHQMFSTLGGAGGALGAGYGAGTIGTNLAFAAGLMHGEETTDPSGLSFPLADDSGLVSQTTAFHPDITHQDATGVDWNRPSEINPFEQIIEEGIESAHKENELRDEGGDVFSYFGLG